MGRKAAIDEKWYARIKARVPAILKLTTSGKGGLEIARFARAIGLNAPNPPNAARTSWTRVLEITIDRLQREGVIVCQKDYPNIHDHPWKVYLPGTEPLLCLQRGWRETKLQQRERQRIPKPGHETSRVARSAPQPETAAGARKKLMRAYHRYLKQSIVRLYDELSEFEKKEWMSPVDIQFRLSSREIAKKPEIRKLFPASVDPRAEPWGTEPVRVAIGYLIESGFFEEGSHVGRKIMVRLAKPPQLSPGDWVFEFVGKPSERMGQVDRIDGNKAFVNFNGMVALVPAERLRKINPEFLEALTPERWLKNEERNGKDYLSLPNVG